MRIGVGYVLVAMLVLASAQASAQIYACTAPDGTRVFSDKRCGPDAKVVKDITTQKKSKTSAAKTPVTPKSPAELEQLLKRCNEGDETACMTWSKGGGPKQLRATEKEQEASCEAGSLAACEQRYCSDGATDECRRRVRSLATMSGATWYLRYQQKRAADAPAIYSIRCLRDDSREIRDVTVTCAATAGPERCKAERAPNSFARLDEATTNYCAVAK
ncbi:MAG TPA: DUF4124 domain-containing protein [Povalibacter sp.]